MRIEISPPFMRCEWVMGVAQMQGLQSITVSSVICRATHRSYLVYGGSYCVFDCLMIFAICHVVSQG